MLAYQSWNVAGPSASGALRSEGSRTTALSRSAASRSDAKFCGQRWPASAAWLYGVIGHAERATALREQLIQEPVDGPPPARQRLQPHVLQLLQQSRACNA